MPGACVHLHYRLGTVLARRQPPIERVGVVDDFKAEFQVRRPVALW
jgi:hypothetical protein